VHDDESSVINTTVVDPHGDAVVQCFHCGAEIPLHAGFEVGGAGSGTMVCSARCADVVAAIDTAGLNRFYTQRGRQRHLPIRLESEFLDHLEAYDDAGLQAQFVERSGEGLERVTLLLEGITCAACVRLVESRLEAMEGVESVSVNGSTHRAEVTWDRRRTKLSDLIRVIYDLGYAAYPFDSTRRQKMLAGERKVLLQRLALGVLFGMQVMMFAIALYTGNWYGMSPDIERFLRWASLVMVVPIMAYCATPFFHGAWRALGNRQLGMDVPVSLALLLAFFASTRATLTGSGDVYFESIAMFVTLLLASRYFELGARIKATRQFDDMARVIPKIATRIDPAGATDTLPVTALRVDDVVLIKAGEVIPVDGIVVAGGTTVDEAVLSGESRPLAKRRDSAVLGGSINIDSPIQVRVSRTVNDSFVSEISRLTQSAQSFKPRLTILANRIASWFIVGVLLITGCVAVYWWFVDPSRVIPTTIAVLVISCPCALALATPAAITAASGAMMRHGVATINPGVIETLAGASAFIFDKTGTLTTGELTLSKLVCAEGGDRVRAIDIAAALSAHSEHSIGRALVRAHQPEAQAGEVENFPGQGISGVVGEERFWFGSARFIAAYTHAAVTGDSGGLEATDKTAFLATSDALVATLQFHDEVKAGAHALLKELRARGLHVAMISGDREQVALVIAAELGITDVRAGMRPEEKLAELERRQRTGAVSVVVGDGINDAPMLAQGYVSVAVGNACDLAKNQADLILLHDDLASLAAAYRISRKTIRVIRQNVAWAIGYNLSALPLAIAGVVPPWVAALGMSLSSLLVVANAARINR